MNFVVHNLLVHTLTPRNNIVMEFGELSVFYIPSDVKLVFQSSHDHDDPEPSESCALLGGLQR